jgi:ubiquitin C-terminal hydrolase
MYRITDNIRIDNSVTVFYCCRMWKRSSSIDAGTLDSRVGALGQDDRSSPDCGMSNVLDSKAQSKVSNGHRRSKSAMIPSLGLHKLLNKSPPASRMPSLPPGSMAQQDNDDIAVKDDMQLKSKKVFSAVKNLEVEELEVLGPKRGIANTGNSCFLGATLQCLLTTPGLAKELVPDIEVDNVEQHTVADDDTMDVDEGEDGVPNQEEGRENAGDGEEEPSKEKDGPVKGELTEAFQNLIRVLWSKKDDDEENDKGVSATPLVNVLKKYHVASDYFHGGQQDAQEVLMTILDLLDEDMKKQGGDESSHSTNSDDSDMKNEGSSEVEKAQDAWDRGAGGVSSSVISDTFLGQLQSSVLCDGCNSRFTTYEPFLELSLSVAPKSSKGFFSWLGFSSLTLSDCLFEYSSGDVLEGDELFFCDKCNCKTKATKHLKLHRLPKALILNIKRFKHTLKSTEKIDKFVSFPLQGLDLRSHVSFECPHPPEECIYDLYAVANHSGSLTMGHYVAYTLTRTEKNGKEGLYWKQCNDNAVTNIANEIVVTPNAYLLFYMRRKYKNPQDAADAYSNLDILEQRQWVGNKNHLI